jgi:hypothetical protein
MVILDGRQEGHGPLLVLLNTSDFIKKKALMAYQSILKFFLGTFE